ncbi:AAA family ATPase [Aphanizomenon flos-aquae CCAP 1446/1C]|uniref:AAA family ATPase n=1 Tax=Anabaena sp. PCC 7938 TaxID=1296340 RepID=UPI002030DAFB|nr:ATP-binding protein [Anabaena sp. CCAP 1446/1C]MBY5310423.1 AAA family ATPase [Anabaena sp. CCAP 1446/1C]
MTTKSPVPRLDLAPKLRRPLSLWNPLDYLLLLYWVFFFPQALRWYVDTFGGGYIPLKINLSKGLDILVQNFVQRQLLLQGVVLTIITPILISLFLQELGLRVDWSGVAFGVAVAVTFSVAIAVAFGVAERVVVAVAGSVAFGVAFGVVGGVVGGVAVAVAFVAAFVVAGFVAFGLAEDVEGSAWGCVAFGMVRGVAFGVAFGVAVAVAGGVATLHPEHWLFGLPFYLYYLRNGSFLLPKITILPLPNLDSRLKKWLLHDWDNGIHNVNQLLAYTMQFIPVVKAVNEVLNTKPPEQIIWSISQLSETTYDWKLIHFASAALNEELKSRAIDGLFFLPSSWKTRLQNNLNTDTRIDTPSRAVAAGFWYLHKKRPFKAEQAFAVVRSLLYGEEMYILALTLAAFKGAQELKSIANLQISTFPTSGLLRPHTWQTLDRFVKVIEDIKIINLSVSRVSRSSALNRALGELTTILNTANTLPKAEQELIIDIARNWQQQLLQIAGEVGEVVLNKPVNNPYVIGDPVMGNLFIGREDIIRQLEELWLRGIQLQSVVIYGHRRMGKTSILLNAANSLDANIKVVYVNLLKLGDVTQGVGEVLMAISDEISQVVNIEPPHDDDLLKLPERTFNRYFEKVITNLSSGLVIAIDEFEKIEDLIKAGKISPDFMGFLRSLVQANSQIAFAFAGLHTLDEMTADYFQPFFASVLPIRVGFLSRGATGQILANPAIEDFLLDYTPEALDKIYDLTHGQPYLVQLVGFHLVRLYNDFVFEQGKPRESVFTLEDVETIVNKPEFFQRGSNYFNGVWGQSGENNDNTQQVILSHLAKHSRGLTLNELIELTGIDETDLQNALEVLKRHDVIVENQGRWRIIVELFRRWVVNM